MSFMMAAAMVAMVGCSGGNGSATETTAQENQAQVSSEKMVIKLAHAAKDGSARDMGAEKIKEVVESESGGTIEV